MVADTATPRPHRIDVQEARQAAEAATGHHLTMTGAVPFLGVVVPLLGATVLLLGTTVFLIGATVLLLGTTVFLIGAAALDDLGHLVGDIHRPLLDILEVLPVSTHAALVRDLQDLLVEMASKVSHTPTESE